MKRLVVSNVHVNVCVMHFDTCKRRELMGAASLKFFLCFLLTLRESLKIPEKTNRKSRKLQKKNIFVPIVLFVPDYQT